MTLQPVAKKKNNARKKQVRIAVGKDKNSVFMGILVGTLKGGIGIKSQLSF